MDLRFDPKSSDLGRSDVSVNLLEFLAAAPHVARILSAANNLGLKNIRYAFEIWGIRESSVAAIMADVEKSLPSNVRFYSVNGTKIFRIKTPEGKFTDSVICYLVAY